MVSGTQCSAWSDPMKKRRESRAAATMGWCPIKQGEFPDILRGIFQAWDDWFRPFEEEGRTKAWRADLRFGGQICGMEGRFDATWCDWCSGGQIWRLEGKFEVSRADLRHGGGGWYEAAPVTTLEHKGIGYRWPSNACTAITFRLNALLRRQRTERRRHSKF